MVPSATLSIVSLGLLPTSVSLRIDIDEDSEGLQTACPLGSKVSLVATNGIAVASRRVTLDSALLVAELEQLRQSGIKGLRDSRNIVQRRIPLPPLNATHVCPVHTCSKCQLFLR